MTGWINGHYSKYHCQEPRPTFDANGNLQVVTCLSPAKLRQFRSDNVPLCDDCFKFIKESEDAE